ncbi:MAG: hypothetical protein ABIW38_04290 [Ferruginibacter sp.]
MASCQKQSVTETTPDSAAQLKKLEVCYTDPASLLQIPVMPPELTAGRVKPPAPSGNYSCIYLDFDGQTVRNSNWNGGATLQCAPAGLNSTQIEEVLNQVRYAYAPYNVVITSNETEFFNANRYMRTRIIVTPTSAWRPGVSGIAYNNSITWGDDTPGFVFSDRLYNITHHIGEIAAHESGHTLSLNHQAVFDSNCGLLESYAMGKIMGNSLYVPNGEWITGTTLTCNTFQNDALILKNKLGLR